MGVRASSRCINVRGGAEKPGPYWIAMLRCVPPAMAAAPRAAASAARSVRTMARPASVRRRAHGADRDLAHQDLGADRRRLTLEHHRSDPLACCAAVLDPGDDLLADVAALGEVEPVQPVEVGFVRKSLAIGKVDAALGDAGRDAVGAEGRLAARS